MTDPRVRRGTRAVRIVAKTAAAEYVIHELAFTQTRIAEADNQIRTSAHDPELIYVAASHKHERAKDHELNAAGRSALTPASDAPSLPPDQK
jgi:hypothetical protein